MYCTLSKIKISSSGFFVMPSNKKIQIQIKIKGYSTSSRNLFPSTKTFSWDFPSCNACKLIRSGFFSLTFLFWVLYKVPIIRQVQCWSYIHMQRESSCILYITHDYWHIYIQLHPASSVVTDDTCRLVPRQPGQPPHLVSSLSFYKECVTSEQKNLVYSSRTDTGTRLGFLSISLTWIMQISAYTLMILGKIF